MYITINTFQQSVTNVISNNAFRTVYVDDDAVAVAELCFLFFLNYRIESSLYKSILTFLGCPVTKYNFPLTITRKVGTQFQSNCSVSTPEQTWARKSRLRSETSTTWLLRARFNLMYSNRRKLDQNLCYYMQLMSHTSSHLGLFVQDCQIPNSSSNHNLEERNDKTMHEFQIKQQEISLQ